MNHFAVDAITGAVLSRAAIKNPTVDTSGALMWRDKHNALAASSGPGSDGHTLLGVESPEYVCCFRYGVCVIRNDNECHLLRFNGEPACHGAGP